MKKIFLVSMCALLIFLTVFVSCDTDEREYQDATNCFQNSTADTTNRTIPSIEDWGDYMQPSISGASIDEIIAECPEGCEFMGGNISKDELIKVFAEFPFEINHITYWMRELSPDVYEKYKEKNWDEYGSFEISIPRSDGSRESIYLYMSELRDEPSKAIYKPHENIPELLCHEKHSHLYVVVINENLYFQLVLKKDTDFSILQQYTEYCISRREIINQESTE